MSNYSEILKNPKWQKKRLEILNRDGFKCKLCGDEEMELHVHHKEYQPGKKPWQYPDDNFQTLCKVCHCFSEWGKPVITFLKVIKKANGDGSFDTTCLILNGENKWIIFPYFDPSKEYPHMTPKAYSFSKKSLEDALNLFNNG